MAGIFRSLGHVARVVVGWNGSVVPKRVMNLLVLVLVLHPSEWSWKDGLYCNKKEAHRGLTRRVNDTRERRVSTK
jgi:hypothetical protein